MKPKYKSQSDAGKQKPLKQLKSIKKPKQDDDTKKKLKNLKAEIKHNDNQFSKFIKHCGGNSLPAVGKQLVKFFRDKNINVPRRKRKFFNLLKACVGDKIPMTDQQKENVFVALKEEYATAGKGPETNKSSADIPMTDEQKENVSVSLKAANKSVTDNDGFTYVGKNKRKKNARKGALLDTSAKDVSMDVEDNQHADIGEKHRKQKERKSEKERKNEEELSKSVNSETHIRKKSRKKKRKQNVSATTTDDVEMDV